MAIVADVRTVHGSEGGDFMEARVAFYGRAEVGLSDILPPLNSARKAALAHHLGKRDAIHRQGLQRIIRLLDS